MSSTHAEDSIQVMKIDGALHVSGVAALKARMLIALETCQVLILDLSEVADCDTASLQLLVAACHTTFPDGKRIQLGANAAAIVTTARKLGVVLAATEQTNKD